VKRALALPAGVLVAAVLAAVAANAGQATVNRVPLLPAPPALVSPQMPLTAVNVSASPNPSVVGNTVTFTWTATGFPNYSLVHCSDSRGWVVNSSYHGSVQKTSPRDFYGNFRWTVTCTDDNFYGTGYVDVVNLPAPCSDPPEWDSSPTLSGTPRVGSVISTNSGNVWCATYLQAHFARTNSVGIVYAWDRDGPVQNCGQPGYVDCSKSDTYTIQAADAGAYIRVEWGAWRPPPAPYPPAYMWTNIIGPVSK
jgi:hypothetical protein